MSRVLLTGEMHASYLIGLNPDLRVVSIGDRENSLPIYSFEQHPGPKIRLLFDDIDRDAPHFGYIPPSMADMRLLIEFLQTHKDDEWLVHCAQGKSRSSAAVMLLGVIRGLSPKDAIAFAENARQETFAAGHRHNVPIRPNRRMIDLGDSLLDLDGELLLAVTETYKYGWVYEG